MVDGVVEVGADEGAVVGIGVDTREGQFAAAEDGAVYHTVGHGDGGVAAHTAAGLIDAELIGGGGVAVVVNGSAATLAAAEDGALEEGGAAEAYSGACGDIDVGVAHYVTILAAAVDVALDGAGDADVGVGHVAVALVVVAGDTAAGAVDVTAVEGGGVGEVGRGVAHGATADDDARMRLGIGGIVGDGRYLGRSYSGEGAAAVDVAGHLAAVDEDNRGVDDGAGGYVVLQVAVIVGVLAEAGACAEDVAAQLPHVGLLVVGALLGDVGRVVLAAYDAVVDVDHGMAADVTVLAAAVDGAVDLRGAVATRAGTDGDGGVVDVAEEVGGGVEVAGGGLVVGSRLAACAAEDVAGGQAVLLAAEGAYVAAGDGDHGVARGGEGVAHAGVVVGPALAVAGLAVVAHAAGVVALTDGAEVAAAEDVAHHVAAGHGDGGVAEDLTGGEAIDDGCGVVAHGVHAVGHLVLEVVRGVGAFTLAAAVEAVAHDAVGEGEGGVL